MNFEHSPQSAHNDIFEGKKLQMLTKKAIESNKNHSLDMKPFIELYGKSTIQEDYLPIAEKIKAHLEGRLSPSEKMGHIFESAFVEIGSAHNWFGDQSELVHTSKYDDINNGVDAIVTIKKEDSSARHIALASDLTYSYEQSSVKYSKIVNDVYAGRLAKIKYFHSDMLGFTGRLTNLPKTVIGIDKNNLKKFLTNWLQEPELAQLQYGALILEQIKQQSISFSALAKKVHGPGSSIEKVYAQSAAISDEIINSTYQGIELPEDALSEAIANQSEMLLLESQ